MFDSYYWLADERMQSWLKNAERDRRVNEMLTIHRAETPRARSSPFAILSAVFAAVRQ